MIFPPSSAHAAYCFLVCYHYTLIDFYPLNIYAFTLREIELDLLDNLFSDQYHITFSLIVLYISSVHCMALCGLLFLCTANLTQYAQV